TVSLSIAKGDLSFKIQKPQENCYYKLEIDCKKSSNGCVQISKVVYNYESSSTSTPTTTNEISFSNGTDTYVKAPVSVVLSAAVAGSTIYYSTDGNKPTKDEEHKYSSPINITKSGTVLKVLAIAEGYDDAEAEATYTIKPAQPVFSEESKTFKEPLNVTLSLPETTDNTSKIYYAIGKNATAESTLYDDTPITIEASNEGDQVTLHAVVVDEYGNVGTQKYCTYTKTTAVVFDFTAYPNVWGIEPGPNTTSNTDGKELPVDGVVLTTTSGDGNNKTCIYNGSSINLRVYTGGTLKFTAPEDYTISKIVFTGTVGLNTEVEVGTLDSKVWTTTDGVNSVVFTGKETSKIQTVTITLVPSVENKTMVATDKEAYYSTFSCDRNVVFTEDVKVYAVNVTGGTLELAELTKGNYNTANSTTETVTNGYYVPANTGVLISAKNANITYYTAVTRLDHASLPNNQLVAATADGMFTGDTDHFKYYKLAYDDYVKKTGLGFYYGAANGDPFEVKKGLAYLAVPVISGGNLAAGYSFGGNGGDDTTGINGIENDNVNETQTIYNLQGQRVEKAGLRGIYIVNGKKVVLK
ncbi:MAG: chitobiase/beta-hexosaminidase C-terminal domain-containing protein, partial [Prevotella sp.]|nr:chitobiase/beta-hexosaminidase C-terminal domain-containing protein [Prevotella sp.]